MFIGINMGIVGSLMGSASILALFAAGEVGVWFDPTDITTLYQDVAGTTPITAAGQPVGLMLDKSKGAALGSNIAIVSSVTGVAIGGPAFTNYSLSPALTIGRAYRISFTVSGYSGSGSVGITDNVGRFQPDLTSFALSGNGTVSVIGIAATTDAVDVFTRSTNTANFSDISVQELAGNHATQAIAAQRPTYGVIPYGGVRNSLTYTEQFDNAVWTKPTAGTGVAAIVTTNYGLDPEGGMTATRLQLNKGAGSTTGDYSGLQYTYGLAAPATGSIWIKTNDNSTKFLVFKVNSTNTSVEVNGTWRRLSVSEATASFFQLILRGTYGTSDTADLLIWHPQLEVGSTATAYQKVVSKYEVTEAGKASIGALFTDGIDDGMVTPSINFSGTNKMTVWAGVQKLSDVALGMIAELSSASYATDGTFSVYASNGGPNYGFLTRGTVSQVNQNSSTFTAPIANVLTARFNNSGSGTGTSAQNRPQVNGTDMPAVSGTSPGNYSNNPFYLFRRGGTISPFNGIFTGLIVRGAQSSAAQISNGNTYINSTLGAY